jgi:rhodanese-related sulfurtransferase
VFHFGKRLWFSLVPAIPRRWALCLTAGQAAAMGLAAVFCGGFYQFASEGGLLANGAATQSFQKGHIASFIPKVGERRVRKLLGTETVFIDARLTRDYKLGHLDSAISLPIDANDVLWKATTAKIPRNVHIVTYCQSAGCKFAQTVSLRLIEQGYWDISIFKGGWAEWTARHGRPQPPQSTGKEVKSENADQNDPA